MQVLLVSIALAAQAQSAQTPKAAAPIDLTGYWVSIVSEDWRYRMVTPTKGDFQGVPVTQDAVKAAEAWNPRYRAGIRYCAAALARTSDNGRSNTYTFDGEEFHIESDMWVIAEAILQMGIPDRMAHGWSEIGWY